MWLRLEQAGFGGRWGNRPKHIDILQCDHCDVEYRLKHRAANAMPPTFCSRSCLAQSPVMFEQKKHLPRKQNGTYGMSYAEGRFYTFLCDQYSSEGIERQVVVNGWSIDFYVKPTKTWVQFDGVYWHGLMYEYGALTLAQRVVYDKDRTQDRWFLACSLKLVRVTDKELTACQQSGDWTNIVTKLGG